MLGLLHVVVLVDYMDAVRILTARRRILAHWAGLPATLPTSTIRDRWWGKVEPEMIMSTLSFTGPNGMGMTDLNSIADFSGRDPSSAYGINNQGQVIAIATIVPESASYALMLGGLGLVGFMARSKKWIA